MLEQVIRDIDIVLDAINNNDLKDASSMLKEIQEELIIIRELEL